MPYIQKAPVSKRELINRMLSNDFDGDFRNLGEGARVSRVKDHIVEIQFPAIGRTFLLSAHIPRDANGDAEEDDFSAPLPEPKPTTRRKGKQQ